MGKDDIRDALPSADQFVTNQSSLLSLEREEETERSRDVLANKGGDIKQLERRGVALRKNAIQERRTGLYGKTILVFGKYGNKKESLELPANTLTNGEHFNRISFVYGIIWYYVINSSLCSPFL